MSWFTRTLEAVGLREKSARPRAGTTVIPSLSLWQQYHRIGGGLTPSQVSSIIREADAGYTTRLIDLANESRQKDGHLQGCLEQSEEAITGLEWELSLPEDAKAKEKRAAEWVESKLRSNAGFHRLIAHLVGAVYYGYAVSEIIWAKEEGRLVPACFENHDARRFGFRQEDGCLVWRDDGMSIGVDLREAFPDKFIISQPRVNGDVPTREGLARLLVWAALFRNWTITDWLRLGEIAWKPWRIGTYKKGAAQEDVDGLTDVLEGMSSNGVAKVPETIAIDVKWAPNATNKPTHEMLYETVAREISKATIGQTETIQASSSSGYGQAKVHNEVRKDLREARAKQVAVDLTRDVVRAMTFLNFGPNVRCAALQFITQDPVDLKGFSEGVKNLKDAGTKIPQQWVRGVHRRPPPADRQRGQSAHGSLLRLRQAHASGISGRCAQRPGRGEGDRRRPFDRVLRVQGLRLLEQHLEESRRCGRCAARRDDGPHRGHQRRHRLQTRAAPSDDPLHVVELRLEHSGHRRGCTMGQCERRQPIKDIQAAKAALWSGRGPGTVRGYCSRTVWDVLARHPQILDLFKFNGSSPGLATPAMLAGWFGLETILVGDARNDTANIGQTASYARMWTDVFGMVRVAQRPTIRNASFGYTFRLNGQTKSTQWYDGRLGYDGRWFSKVAVSDDYKVVAADTGYLLTTPVG